MKRLSLSFGQLLMISAAVWAAPQFEPHTLAPVDEASTNADFLAFRQSLVAAVQNKDVDSLLKHLDDNIKTGFGGDDGIDAFKQTWQLNSNPGASPLWQKLGRILELGGSFDGDQFVAPYVFSKWPDSYESEQFGVITGTNVNIRARAELDAPAVKQVSNEVVRFLFDDWTAPGELTLGGETWPWVKVGLSNGSEGYVWGKYFHSPMDLRAGFRAQNAEWKMVFLVAGD